MKKYSILLIVSLVFSISTYAQEIKKIKSNQTYSDFHIEESQEKTFQLSLKKNTFYSIIVTQKGIDVELFLKDNQGNDKAHQDTPNGKNGPEKMVFFSETSASYLLTVKPFIEEANSKSGDFSIFIKEEPKSLERISYDKLIQDFEILKNVYIETHVGLWYNTYSQFDSICNVQKQKIKVNMNALDFYKIMAPITAFVKEGHCYFGLSDQIWFYVELKGRYLPFQVKILDSKAYLLNNLDNFKTQGLLISKINGNSIDKILKTFLSIEPNDGYNETGKYGWIENAFSSYYMRFFETTPKSFDLELIDPDTKEKIEYKNIPSYSYKERASYFESLKKTLPKDGFSKAITFSMDSLTKTATLAVNIFDTRSYKNGKEGFHAFLGKTFKTIIENNIENLIIDVRRNEGGQQGMEDYLLSYLIDKPYHKYKYVEIPSFTYSFIKYTDYKDDPDNVKNGLKKEFARQKDGRYLNIRGTYEGTAPDKNYFKGKIYILIGRQTFSGGSEFAALAKNYTDAIFIGQETNGGFYGNTSGNFLNFTLPNSKLKGRVPLCKFVLETKDFDIPFGRGVIPDFKVQQTIKDYLNEVDTEMIFTKNLIENGSHKSTANAHK